MKALAKLTFAAILAAMLTIDVQAAATGSCQKSAASISLGKTVTGKLVDTYDEDWGTVTGEPVYYFKLTVRRGDSATLIMSGESPYIYDVYEDGDYEGESESSPPWWEDASNPYAAETRMILRAGDWDTDAPSSVTYYIRISGDEIGQGFSLETMSGEVEPRIPNGIDVNTALLVTPKTTVTSTKGDMTEAHTSGYYFKANLTAGQKYYFGTYDTSTNATDVSIDGLDDSSAVPTMTPVEGKIDGVQFAGGSHAGYCVIPSETMTYVIFVSNDSTNSTSSVMLHHKMVAARLPNAHALAATLGTPTAAGASASISPAYRNNPGSGFFDSVIDDALVSVTLEKGKKYLFNVDNLSFDPGNLLMEVYDAKGNILASSTIGFLGEGTVGPMLVCEVAANGTYYVGVCQDTADSKGDESPTLGLTGRISASTVTVAEDAFLDEYDDRVDPNAEVTPVTPAIGEYGEAPELFDVEGQVHSFGLTDWTDTFSLPVRKGITYSFSIVPKTGMFTNGTGEVEVSGAGFTYAGTIYTLSGRTKTELRTVSDLSAEPLSIQAGANTTYYLEITKNGQGVPAVYSLHAMASAPDGLGYLTVNIHGPTAEAGAGWYLKGDSASLKNASGTTMLLPAGTVIVKFTAAKGFSTAADMTGTVAKDDTTTLEAYYNDTSDPLDDSPDTTKKEPTLKKAYAPTKLTPSAKGVSAGRSLWKVDPADWFTFTATAGTFYKFSLSDIEGDPEVRVYGPNNWTNECEYVIATNAAEAVQICAEKGTYYVKVAHADAEAPEDSAYTLTAVSAVPGVVKLAKTSLSVKDSAGYVDLSVSRTGKEGLMRVKYRTEGAQTDKDNAYFYPTNGVLTWAANDNKAQTVRVKLVPFAGWDTNKVFKVVFEPFSTDDETFDASVEYPATFAIDTKTKLPLDTATITIAASSKKTPGTIQVADSDTPKKPIYTVVAGETIEIPFVRVLGADGVVGVKVETVKGTANKSGETDFTPVTTNFAWNAGEATTQTVAVATKKVASDYTATKTFTLKLTALTSKKDDAVQYDKPTLAASVVTVNIVNDKFADTMANYAKTVTAVANGYTVKEGKAGQWVVYPDGSFYAPNGGDLTFTFSTTGTFTYTVNGESKSFTATAKDKTLKITGATTFSIDNYVLDGTQVALRQGMKYAESFGTNGTVKAANLPAGLKLAQDKTTKEWTVSGVPSKAGVFQTVFTTTIGKNPATIETICYTVAAQGTSAGTFTGLLMTFDTTNRLPSLASVTITAALGGKLSAKVAIAGKSYTFADTGYTSCIEIPGEPVYMTAELPLVQKIGSGTGAVTVTNWLYYTVTDVAETNSASWVAEGVVDVQMAALPDVKGKGFQEDVSYTGKIYRDNAKMTDKGALAAWQALAAKYAGYYTVSLVASLAMDGEPCGSGYMTLTLDAKGKVKVAGKLADGTAYSASATAAFVGAVDSPSIRVPLYACKGTSVFGGWLSIRAKAGGGLVAEIDSPDTDILWANDDPNATRDGEEGFELNLDPVGGWYDTVSNLQRSYLESDLSVNLPEGDEALEDIMDALELGGDYAFVAQPSGQAVDLVGNTLSVVKQTLVKDASKKLNDWDASVNASNVKVTFKRATGVVNGTFDLWYEGTNAKGAREQKSITGLKHEGVLILSRGDDLVLDNEVLSSGFFLAPQKIKYDVNGRTQTRTWNGSYRFDINAIPVERIWTDAE